MSGDPLDTRLLEGEGAGFECFILHSDAGMLTYVLGPRGDEESFQVALGLGQIAKEPPTYGAFPAAEDAHLLHTLDELTRVLHRYTMFDSDEHWPIIRVRCKRQFGIWPVTGGREVKLLDPM